MVDVESLASDDSEEPRWNWDVARPFTAIYCRRPIRQRSHPSEARRHAISHSGTLLEFVAVALGFAIARQDHRAIAGHGDRPHPGTGRLHPSGHLDGRRTSADGDRRSGSQASGHGQWPSQIHPASKVVLMI